MQTLRSPAVGATLALLALQAVLPASAQAPAAQVRMAPVSAVKVPDLTRAVLPNGITVIVMPQREVPLIAFNAVLRGGAAVDPVGKSGVAALVADLLDKGAGSRDAFAFADAVAGVGGSFGSGAGNESISVGGQFMATDRALMIELLADALQRPRFEADEFQKLRQRDVEFIKAAKDSDPSQLLGIYGRAALFGSHPYARPVEGSESSLRLIELSDVQSYYRSQFGADRLTLVFTGDIDVSVLMSEVERAFASWGKATATLPALASPPPIRGRRVLLVDSPGSVQTYFWIGSVGVAMHAPRHAAVGSAQGHQGRGAAVGVQIDQPVLDHGRGAVLKHDDRTAVEAHQIFLPDDSAIRHVEAEQFEIGSQHEDRAAIHRRRGARAVVQAHAAVRITRHADRRRPKLRAIGRAQGHGHLRVRAGDQTPRLREDAPAADREAAEAVRYDNTPEGIGDGAGPLLIEAVGGNGVVIRAAKLRPVRRAGGE